MATSWKQFREDLLWLAGWLEGEGCFGVMDNSVPRIDAWCKDKDVIQRVAKIMRVKIYRRKIVNQCPLWGFTFANRKAAGWMMMLFSFLGERRRHAIQKALNKWRTKKYVRHGYAGKGLHGYGVEAV